MERSHGSHKTKKCSRRSRRKKEVVICKGPKGDPGKEGVEGPAGPQGPTGPQGPAGTVGPVLFLQEYGLQQAGFGTPTDNQRFFGLNGTVDLLIATQIRNDGYVEDLTTVPNVSGWVVPLTGTYRLELRVTLSGSVSPEIEGAPPGTMGVSPIPIIATFDDQIVFDINSLGSLTIIDNPFMSWGTSPGIAVVPGMASLQLTGHGIVYLSLTAGDVVYGGVRTFHNNGGLSITSRSMEIVFYP